jgi:hypothetical protein
VRGGAVHDQEHGGRRVVQQLFAEFDEPTRVDGAEEYPTTLASSRSALQWTTTPGRRAAGEPGRTLSYVSTRPPQN